MLRFLPRAFAAAVGVFLLLCIHVLWSSSGDATFPADCALIFGASVGSGVQPSPAMQRRTQTAIALAQQGNVTGPIVVSGGRGEGQRESEAAAMRKILFRGGIDPERVVLEDQATSTWENLENAQPLLLGCTSVLGISDGYHLARIRVLADRQRWKGITLAPATGRPPLLALGRSVAREAFGLLYYGALEVPRLLRTP